MKKLNQLSNLFFNSIVTILIIILICLFNIFNQMMEPTYINEPNYKEELIVYDVAADWSTVKQADLQPKTIDRELKGHFVDPETNGCFFIAMKMLDIDVDIDKYYQDFFQDIDLETFHQGKISPEIVHQNSLVYIASNNLNISVKDISNKSKEYLISVIKNNYPIIIWYGNKDWTMAIPYVIYGIDSNIIYMCNIDNTIGVNIDTFFNNYSNNAIVYGKYW